MKRKLLCLLLVFCVVLGVTSSAMAASYSYTFVPPYAGCMNSTGTTSSASSSPYVKPSATAAGTNYVLSPKQMSSTAASNIITNKTSSTSSSFTYETGYGGSGQSYYMSGYPYSTNFTTYSVGGTWSA